MREGVPRRRELLRQRGSRAERGDGVRCRKRRIVPSDRIPVNNCELAEHAYAIPEEPHFRSGLIGPIHGNFCDPIAALLSHEQQFKIKAISVDGRHGEEIACDRSFE